MGWRTSSIENRSGWRKRMSAERTAVAGFTLIELLVVMVVIVTLMGVAAPAFLDIGRGIGMRTSVNNVRSTLSLARQWAITHREKVYFTVRTDEWVYNMTNSPDKRWSNKKNEVSCYYASNTAGDIVQSVITLPLDVVFTKDGETIVFKPDGGLDSGLTTKEIVLQDRQKRSSDRTIKINGLTGAIKVE